MSGKHIPKSQRERDAERRAFERILRDELHRFALWMSPTWDKENEDDVAAALQWVDHYIEGGTND